MPSLRATLSSGIRKGSFALLPSPITSKPLVDGKTEIEDVS
jgi:hypothetical protein